MGRVTQRMGPNQCQVNILMDKDLRDRLDAIIPKNSRSRVISTLVKEFVKQVEENPMLQSANKYRRP